MGITSYKNHGFGTFTLRGDELAWVDSEGVEGTLALVDVGSVWLGEQSTGGTASAGQASLTGVLGGTVLKTIPGTPPVNLGGGVGLWAMKIRADDQLVSIYCNPATQDDEAAFTHFVRAVHKNIAKASPSTSYIGGGVLNFLVFVFLSIVLLVLGGSAAFLGKATGLSFLIVIGSVLVLSALALLIWGVRTTKPKTYDPNNIPAKLFPDAQSKETKP